MLVDNYGHDYMSTGRHILFNILLIEIVSNLFNYIKDSQSPNTYS